MAACSFSFSACVVPNTCQACRGKESNKNISQRRRGGRVASRVWDGVACLAQWVRSNTTVLSNHPTGSTDLRDGWNSWGCGTSFRCFDPPPMKFTYQQHLLVVNLLLLLVPTGLYWMEIKWLCGVNSVLLRYPDGWLWVVTRWMWSTQCCSGVFSLLSWYKRHQCVSRRHHPHLHDTSPSETQGRWINCRRIKGRKNLCLLRRKVYSKSTRQVDSAFSCYFRPGSIFICLYCPIYYFILSSCSLCCVGWFYFQCFPAIFGACLLTWPVSLTCVSIPISFKPHALFLCPSVFVALAYKVLLGYVGIASCLRSVWLLAGWN